jgi:D-alanyl-lipoteichoic acid acyltransferase DltB (MBOAT superfamily)
MVYCTSPLFDRSVEFRHFRDYLFSHRLFMSKDSIFTFELVKQYCQVQKLAVKGNWLCLTVQLETRRCLTSSTLIIYNFISFMTFLEFMTKPSRLSQPKTRY